MRGLRVAGGLWVLALAGCTDNPPIVIPPGGFYLLITASPALVSLPLGGEATVNFVVTRGGGYPGTITVVVEGLPANVIPTLAPPSLPSGSDRGVLTLRTNGQATPGSYSFVIRASGDEVDPVTTTAISLLVTSNQ